LKSIEQARSLYYKFFATAFGFIDENSYDILTELIKLLKENPMDTVSFEALCSMYEFLENGGTVALKSESDDLFISPESSFVPVSASYYDEGRDDGKKRLDTISLILKSAFRKNEFACKDSEDSVCFLCQFMQALTLKQDENSLEIAKNMFKEILNDFIDDFAMNLYRHENGDFYKNLAIVLSTFGEFERFYLGVAPSLKTASSERISAVIKKDRKPMTQKIRRNLDEIVL
jgi:TorA maturation chaperone TorD